MPIKLHAVLIALILSIASIAAADAQRTPSRASDCNAALSKDYYSYASRNNLFSDYLKSIDSETYSKLTQDNQFFLEGLTQYGPFKVGDDYKSFDEKRTKYLENVHYTRTQQQATDILKLTTSDRAYNAYETCIRSIGTGGGLLVWASQESLDVIDLHVKYANPPSVTSMILTGDVSGGSVEGAPAGKLWPDHTFFTWNDTSKWGVNQERVYAVHPEHGVNDTRVSVKTDNGEPPVTLHFFRADGELMLDFVGVNDVARQLNATSPVIGTPNNNENRGGCPNEFGRADGKYCISRTTVSLSVSPPYYLRNATAQCSGGGCPWGHFIAQPSFDMDSQRVTAQFDNWGSAVSIFVLANVYEHVNTVQCGGSQGPFPVRFNQAVIFHAADDCKPLAVVRWKRLPGQEQGIMPFGQPSGDNSRVKQTGSVEGGGVLSASYELLK